MMRTEAAWFQSPVPVELLDTGQMAQADRRAVELGVPGSILMEAAGRAVAQTLHRNVRPCRTLVLCGPGNNGGDGYVAARLLHQDGWPVAVAALAPPRVGSDAAWAAARWNGPMVPFSPAEAARADWVIDAVFGAGLTRAVDDAVADVLQAARRVIAVDVPSGVCGDDGRCLGRVRPVEATVTFFRLKPGHLLYPGRAACGRVRLADIGMPPCILDGLGSSAVLNSPQSWRALLAPPVATAHKYTRGAVAILADDSMPGAARLAAMGARRAGAGHVTIYAHDAVALQEHAAGVIVSPTEMPVRCDSLVIGPGLPPDAATRARLQTAVQTGARVLADAGVLTACSGQPGLLQGATWITPHVAEFKKLFGITAGEITNKLSAARDAARQTGTVVVLKGADTVIAAPDGRAAVNAHAPSALASAGTGDVLAGIIAALGTDRTIDPFLAACAGVWLHGEAGYRAGEYLIAEDLPVHLPGAIMKARACPQVSG